MVLIGQVSRTSAERGAFQEVDYAQFFGGMAKGVSRVFDADKAARWGRGPSTSPVPRAYQVRW